jgi:hypothetical protein
MSIFPKDSDTFSEEFEKLAKRASKFRSEYIDFVYTLDPLKMTQLKKLHQGKYSKINVLVPQSYTRTDEIDHADVKTIQVQTADEVRIGKYYGPKSGEAHVGSGYESLFLINKKNLAKLKSFVKKNQTEPLFTKKQHASILK